VMLFYITGGAPQAVPGTACVVANQTACTEVCCCSAGMYNCARSEHNWSVQPPAWTT
jgi:hypothetical protein